MTTSANGTFQITGWDETEIHPGEGLPKMSAAHVTAEYSGAMEGDGLVEYLMCYENEASASFVGMERFVGTLDGKQGSFVMRVAGTFGGGVASGTRTIVKGTGTGALEGITGEGSFRAVMGEEATYEMVYEV
jgi:uncharacterized protein DUF3224